MKITVVGVGYVGLSSAMILARKHSVTCYDSNFEKLNSLDSLTLNEKKVHLLKAFSSKEAYCEAEMIFVCVPTNLNKEQQSLDTSNLEDVLNNISVYRPQAKVIIKSTLSMESISFLKSYEHQLSIFYAPEFLKENTALHDSLYPSRIVLGYLNESDVMTANEIATILKDCTETPSVETIITSIGNAIAIKLFSNAYLAMRLSFFNELDSFSQFYDLNTLEIIEGVSLDPRIGDTYNHPSFGFKGYCLPKDTISLTTSFFNVPSAVIPAIIESNQKRISYAIEKILEYIKNNHCKKIGIYRLTMEKNSKNVRFSIMEDVIKGLKNYDIEPLVYEPLLKENNNYNVQIISFQQLLQCDVIITNRFQEELSIVKEKVYTWDIEKNK